MDDWVYDGIICPIGSDGHQAPYAAMVFPAQTAKLREAIRLAKAEGRVISRLAQLEVPGGSLDGAGPVDMSPTRISKGDDDGDDKENRDKQPSPTKEELKYIARIRAFRPMPTTMSGRHGGRARWTFRR